MSDYTTSFPRALPQPSTSATHLAAPPSAASTPSHNTPRKQLSSPSPEIRAQQLHASPAGGSVAQATSSRRYDPLLPGAASVTKVAPATGLYWSPTPVHGRLPRGLRAHSSTMVGTDMWVFGGCDIRGTCFKDVWKLNCDTFAWSRPKVAGDVPPVSRAHTSVEVDGRLFIIGGGDGPSYYNSVYFLDTITLTWHKPRIKGEPPSKRRAHTAVHYKQSLILFGGGNGSKALNDLFSLDVSAYMAGGQDPLAAWDFGGSKHTRKDSKGRAVTAQPAQPAVEWKELAVTGPRPTPRGYHTSSLVGEKLVVLGGSDGAECFSDVWILDLEHLTWSEVKLDMAPSPGLGSNPTYPTSFPRLSHSATLVGSYIVMIGGHDGQEYQNSVVLFNLVNLTWEVRRAYGQAPPPRGYHTAVLHDSRLLLLGGFNGQIVYEDIWTLELAASSFLVQITNFEIPDVTEEQ